MTLAKRKPKVVDPWDKVEREIQKIISSYDGWYKMSPIARSRLDAYKIALDIIRRHRPKKRRKG